MPAARGSPSPLYLLISCALRLSISSPETRLTPATTALSTQRVTVFVVCLPSVKTISDSCLSPGNPRLLLFLNTCSWFRFTVNQGPTVADEVQLLTNRGGDGSSKQGGGLPGPLLKPWEHW